MSRRTTSTEPGSSAERPGRKSTQRERLLAGMIAAANRDGYAGANVSAVITAAGVSRPTFYEYFGDKDDCFLACIREVQGLLLAQIAAAIHEDTPEHAGHAVVRALLAFASAEPAMTRFLTNEPIAGGPKALDTRDEGIAEIERTIERRLAGVEPHTPVPDLSVRVMIGGIYRLLASRLRRGEPSLTGVLADLHAWMDSYALPIGEHRWRTLSPAPAPAPSPFAPREPLRAPPPLPPGRPRITEEEVAANHRERIMFAAAELAQQKGYRATTITDITKRARVDGRIFYAMFADKQDAFMAIHELGFQRVMAVTAEAFFSGESWQERNWEGGRAFTQFLERNPLIANVGFVEAYAVGPGAVQRVEDSHLAFAMLLQEGYQHAARSPPRLVLEAIITTIFETVYHRTRTAEGAPELAGMLPHFTFLVLAPFSGAVDANAFIDSKL